MTIIKKNDSVKKPSVAEIPATSTAKAIKEESKPIVAAAKIPSPAPTVKSQELLRKPLAPPPPISESKQVINANTLKDMLAVKLSEEVFEEICDEVIKCDDKAPSVPDVILQVISEILAENSHQIKPPDEVENISASVPNKELASPLISAPKINNAKDSISKIYFLDLFLVSMINLVIFKGPIDSTIKSLHISHNNPPNLQSSSSNSSQQSSPNHKNSPRPNNSFGQSAQPVPSSITIESKQVQILNRNRTRKTITKT